MNDPEKKLTFPHTAFLWLGSLFSVTGIVTFGFFWRRVFAGDDFISLNTGIQTFLVPAMVVALGVYFFSRTRRFAPLVFCFLSLLVAYITWRKPCTGSECADVQAIGFLFSILFSVIGVFTTIVIAYGLRTRFVRRVVYMLGSLYVLWYCASFLNVL